MLGRVEVVVDRVSQAAPTFVAFNGAQAFVNGASLQFWVEEDEMFVDLTAKITYSNTVVEGTDFTIFVSQNGVAAADIAVGANGLARHTAAIAADENTVIASRTVRLPKGRHVATIRAFAPTGVVTVQGASIPCELMAFRNSHIATLGHGVDSKFQFAQ